MPPDLWSFANTLYARPGIEAACLRLQEDGTDVCLLLCAAWLHRRGAACTPDRVDALRAVAAPWQQEVVTPLRQIRQGWREAAAHDNALSAIREQVKVLELEAERHLLDRLMTAAGNWKEGEAQGDWLGAVAGQHDRGALEQVRAAIIHT